MRPRSKLTFPARWRLSEAAQASAMPDNTDHKRPKTRGECGEERPCPFASCQYHLHLDVSAVGTLQTAPGELWDMKETCTLDVADRGGVTLETIADLMGCTRERIRQIEAIALRKLERRLRATELAEANHE